MITNIIDLTKFNEYTKICLKEINSTKFIEKEGNISPFVNDEYHFNITKWNLKGEFIKESFPLDSTTK